MGGAVARRLCPQAVVVSPRMSAYSEASRAVFEIFADTSPLVEGLSIDEAFLDVRGLQRIAGPPMDIAVRLRREVLERVGLPITVGVARTKFLAKVASGVAKPDGLLVVPPGGELAFLHLLPVERLWGVGPVTAAKLRDRGITSVGEVARLAEPALVALVGRAAGRKLHALAHNRDPRPVQVGVPPALDGRAARARAPAALARGARRRPRRARRPHRPPAARRAPRVPDRGAAPALRRLLARDPVAHPRPRHPADRADPRHRASPARDGRADDRAPGPDAARASRSPTSRTPRAVQLVLRLRAPRTRSTRRSTACATASGRRPSPARCCSAAIRARRCRCCPTETRRLPIHRGRVGHRTWPKSATTPSPPKTPARPRRATRTPRRAPHPGAAPGSAEPGDSGPSPDAPDTSHERGGRRRAGDRQPEGRRLRAELPDTPQGRPMSVGHEYCANTTRPSRTGRPHPHGWASFSECAGTHPIGRRRGVLGWCAAPASATPTLLAQWTLDEGAGQVAADASGHANTGSSARRPTPTPPIPDWIPGHAGGSALDFDGTSYVTITNTGLLEPPRLAVDAWVRRSGSPGRWRYVLSNGSLQCNRSAYGLYSGWSGGMALLRLQRGGVHDLARGPGRDRVGRRVAPRHRLLRRRPRAAVDRRLAGRRGHADDRGRSSTRTAAAASTSAPIAARATSASAARSTTSRCGTTARRRRRPGPVIDPVRRHADAHRASAPATGSAAPGATKRPSRTAACACQPQPPARSRCAARRSWWRRCAATGSRVAGVRLVVSGKGVTTTGRRAPTARARPRSPCAHARPGA